MLIVAFLVLMDNVPTLEEMHGSKNIATEAAVATLVRWRRHYNPFEDGCSPRAEDDDIGEAWIIINGLIHVWKKTHKNQIPNNRDDIRAWKAFFNTLKSFFQ